MNKENENKLFEKYPIIFPNGRDVEPTKSLICFGIACDDGWYDLINELCQNIMEEYNKITDEKVKTNFFVVQVKEKFGGLRFYTSVATENIYELISKTEKKSYKTCESCGETGSVRDKLRWIKTLCGNCFNTRLEEQNKRLKRLKIVGV